MRAADVIEWGGQRVRVAPWRGGGRTAQLTPLPGVPLPSTGFVRRCIDELTARGFDEVVTGALSPAERAGFVSAGFEVREELHLLAHDLRELPAPCGIEALLRRGRRDDRPTALAVDRLAFTAFWRLDDGGFDEALRATPAARFRVADHEAALVAYAISGRAGRRGYLQRLAVHPAYRRAGIGRALVLDGLRWLRRWAVDHVVVNTQLDNEPALALYLRMGFRLQPERLAVLGRRLDRP